MNTEYEIVNAVVYKVLFCPINWNVLHLTEGRTLNIHYKRGVHLKVSLGKESEIGRLNPSGQWEKIQQAAQTTTGAQDLTLYLLNT